MRNLKSDVKVDLKSEIAGKKRTINNQFGEFEINLDKCIFFPSGIIGIPQASKFVLLPCPLEEFKDFMILQSLELDELSFMVLPINDIRQSEYHEKGDLENLAKALVINPENAVVVLVVSLKKTPEYKELITNTRAPIFIDCEAMAAVQYVLPNPNYEIQKRLRIILP